MIEGPTLKPLATLRLEQERWQALTMVTLVMESIITTLKLLMDILVSILDRDNLKPLTLTKMAPLI